MNCVRCKRSDSIQNGIPEKNVEVNETDLIGDACQTRQNDIGGFAELSGLHMLKSSQKQVALSLLYHVSEEFLTFVRRYSLCPFEIAPFGSNM